MAKLAGALRIFIMALIISNVMAVVIESDAEYRLQYAEYFENFEIFSVLIFTIEYLVRWFMVTKSAHKNVRIKTFLRYPLTGMAIIDLMAILPFYLPHIITMDMRYIRILRIFRLFRIFKLGRYAESMTLIGKAVVQKREELISSLAMTTVLMLIASAIMYEFEHAVQPKAYPNIVETMWWAVATLTTVGYGDVYPVTGPGKVLAGIVAILGVGLVAIPTGLLSASFLELLQERREKIMQQDDKKNHEHVCPHCGKAFSEKG